MTNSDKVFTGSIPQFYDTYMVPMIFQDYADDLAARVAHLRPASVLETAAGSGVVPRALAGQLDPDARYVATDLNQAMLDHAAARQPKDHPITWQQADALDLPFDSATFDVVICQFGAMFFPDRSKGYAEARRVLKPGGRYIFSVWDSLLNNELADVVSQAAGQVFPDDPPLFIARTPHGYHDRDLIRADLQRAGFTDITIEDLEQTSVAPTAEAAAKAFCHGTPLRNEIEARGPALLDHVTERTAAAIAARFGKGPVTSRMSALIVTATP